MLTSAPEALRGSEQVSQQLESSSGGTENGAPFLLASPRAPGRTTPPPPSRSALDWIPEAWGLGSEPRPHLIRRGVEFWGFRSSWNVQMGLGGAAVGASP